MQKKIINNRTAVRNDYSNVCTVHVKNQSYSTPHDITKRVQWAICHLPLNMFPSSKLTAVTVFWVPVHQPTAGNFTRLISFERVFA
jgi:hypothetical protein